MGLLPFSYLLILPKNASWGELKLADFHALVKVKKSSVCIVEDDSNVSEIFPKRESEIYADAGRDKKELKE